VYNKKKHGNTTFYSHLLYSPANHSVYLPVRIPLSRLLTSIASTILLFLTGCSAGRSLSKTKMEGRVEFLGVFTHTVHWLPFDKQVETMEEILARNPYIKGVGIRAPWRFFSPTKDACETKDFLELVRFLKERKLHVYVALIPGSLCTPGWVFDEGAGKITTHGPLSQVMPYTVVPWDPVYMKHWEIFLKKIAPIIEAEEGIFSVDILGHNAMMEMHMPGGEENLEQWRSFGWSPEVVWENWKHWVDFYAGQFPHKKLAITLSLMYGPETADLTTRIATYAIEKYPSRIILTNHQLHGRFDYMNAEDPQHGSQIKFRDRAPSGWECLGSWWQQPDRQGSVDLAVYNTLKANPLFIQIWNRDALVNPDYAGRIAECFEEYSRISPAELKEKLQAEGKYKTREQNTWKPKDHKPGSDSQLPSPSKERYPEYYEAFRKGFAGD